MKSCLQVCICLIVLSAAAEPVHASPWGSLALGSDGYFYGDNSTADITTQVTWNSSNTGAATIGASTGLATGVKTVPANITASLNG
jgi:hypothetical protein